MTVHERRPEKTCREKNPTGEKSQQEIWGGSMAHALKSPPYEVCPTGRLLPTITKHVFQQSTVNSKYLFENKRKITKTSQNPCATRSET